jgi:hypothetical protein
MDIDKVKEEVKEMKKAIEAVMSEMKSYVVENEQENEKDEDSEESEHSQDDENSDDAVVDESDQEDVEEEEEPKKLETIISETSLQFNEYSKTILKNKQFDDVDVGEQNINNTQHTLSSILPCVTEEQVFISAGKKYVFDEQLQSYRPYDMDECKPPPPPAIPLMRVDEEHEFKKIKTI